jgi:hypothetical protein
MPEPALHAPVKPLAREGADAGLEELVQELAAGFVLGYTEEAVNHAFALLADATGLDLVCLWEFHDWICCGGSFQWFVLDADGRLWELHEDVYGWLSGQVDRPAPVSDWVGSLTGHHQDKLAWSDDRHNFAETQR